MPRPLPLVLCLLLAACSQAKAPPAPQSAEALPPPAPEKPMLAGIDLTQPITLNGTEPFWSLTVENGAITFSTPEKPNQPFPGGGFTVSGDTARLASGALSATLKAGACSDGMSDRTYPLTAEVVIDNKTYQGCAMPRADMDRSKP